MISRKVRERVKHLPIVGPILHGIYLRLFFEEGTTLKIQDGPLRGHRWIRFMHTYNDQYVSGAYEADMQHALVRHLRPGMVFYDVGANAGFFTLLGACLVGNAGHVVSFEPHPTTARLLKKQVSANGIENVSVVKAAVTKHVGVAQFSDDRPSVMNSLVAPGQSERMVEVKTTTLDWEAKRYPPPDLIKIDVEGAEIDVLQGAVELIKRNRPILLVEIHSHAIALQYDEIIADLGYQTESLQGSLISVAGSGERNVVSRSIN